MQTLVPPYRKKNGDIKHHSHLMIQMPESDKSKNYRLVSCLLSKTASDTWGLIVQVTSFNSTTGIFLFIGS